MARIACTAATVFAELLNAKFAGQEEFTVVAGNKMDKVCHLRNGEIASIHCFIRKEDGAVFKAAGFNAPAKGVRFANVLEAAEKADRWGSYLYK